MAIRIHDLRAHLLALILTGTWVRYGLALFLQHGYSFLSGGSTFALTGTGESASLDNAHVAAHPSHFPWIMVAIVSSVTAVVFVAVNAAKRRGLIRPSLPLFLSSGAVVLAAIPFVMSRFSFSDDVTVPMVATALLLWIFASSFIVYWGSAQAVTRLSSRR